MKDVNIWRYTIYSFSNHSDLYAALGFAGFLTFEKKSGFDTSFWDRTSRGKCGKFLKFWEKRNGYDQILYIFWVQNPPDLKRKRREISWDISFQWKKYDIILMSSDSPSRFWQHSRFKIRKGLHLRILLRKMRYCCASRCNRTWIRLFGNVFFFGQKIHWWEFLNGFILPLF